jgi:hypothetical protein
MHEKPVLPEMHSAKITSARHLADGYGYGVEFRSIDEVSPQAIKDLFNRLISHP